MSNMNSGYFGYQMSNRAVDAYNNGSKPLSKWRKQDVLDSIIAIAKENEIEVEIDSLKKCKAQVLKDYFLYNCEWHHTSSFCNETDFYDVDEDKVIELNADEIATLIEKSKVKKVEPEKVIYKGSIKYIEWGGTRNYPKAIKHELENVNIEEKGSFYIITNDNGEVLLRKKIGSNGTVVTNYKIEEEKKAKEEYMMTHSSKEAIDFFNSMKRKEYSRSGKIYPLGRKPNSYEYESGDFFEVGEHRLAKDINSDNMQILYLETWNGEKWVRERNNDFECNNIHR